MLFNIYSKNNYKLNKILFLVLGVWKTVFKQFFIFRNFELNFFIELVIFKPKNVLEHYICYDKFYRVPHIFLEYCKCSESIKCFRALKMCWNLPNVKEPWKWVISKVKKCILHCCPREQPGRKVSQILRRFFLTMES
jgi:hypothetical protein